MKKVNLFISYAHQDKDLLDKLLVYLNERSCPDINIWQDAGIQLGENWDEKIKDQLNKADIVLLLISQNFLNSSYIANNEITTALERNEQKKSTVIPIYLRYCNLESYKHITKLQGHPNPQEVIEESGPKMAKHFTDIQMRVNKIALDRITESNMSDARALEQSNPTAAANAIEIEHLSTANKIFLSLPLSSEGRTLRKNFISTVEGKIQRDPNWQYQIVPGLEDAERLYDSNQSDQLRELSQCLRESIYDIHIVGSEIDLQCLPFREQISLAREQRTGPQQMHTILWFQSSAVKDKLDRLDDSFRQELKSLPTVYVADCEEIFRMIEGKDEIKKKKISELRDTYSPVNKVFMLYNPEMDRDNDLMLDLKEKIQDSKDFTIRELEDSTNENQAEELKECNSAIIFYGPDCTDAWYRTQQKTVLLASNIKYRAVCVDGKEEQDIQRRIRRDVRYNEITPIKGKSELEAGITEFKNKLRQKVQ